MTASVRLDGVSFRYPTEERPAVSGLTLDLERGRITWIMGQLGAGCSTLLHVVAGLAPRLTGGTRGGTVLTLGVDPATVEGRRALAGRIGYVTASPHLQLSGLASTVAEEAAFGPANMAWPIERIRPAVADALATLGIAHLADRPPVALSGGELQRAVLASMLVLAPDLWLLDEPAAPLDGAGREVFTRLLRAEASRGATVVIASEEADLLCQVADRLLVLRGGRVVLDGPPAAILAGEPVWEAGAGSTAIAALAREARRIEPGLFEPPYPLTVEEGVARWSR